MDATIQWLFGLCRLGGPLSAAEDGEHPRTPMNTMSRPQESGPQRRTNRLLQPRRRSAVATATSSQTPSNTFEHSIGGHRSWHCRYKHGLNTLKRRICAWVFGGAAGEEDQEGGALLAAGFDILEYLLTPLNTLSEETAGETLDVGTLNSFSVLVLLHHAR